MKGEILKIAVNGDIFELRFFDGETVTVSREELRQSENYIFNYGLRQILNDAHAMSKQEMTEYKDVSSEKKQRVLRKLALLRDGYSGKKTSEFIRASRSEIEKLQMLLKEAEEKIRNYENMMKNK